ncbi:hypothetical protein [Chondrinema litorale]|uniref:hypothetical protein n=1 Tax=Chondrinema litorale TaxID=2994555 RepID=UPI002542E088|nr:hypothetical protein [Chondrinema litorale]UZR93384.1 hypothetical protein OQ292_16135 [Chondrinema litorale]
MKNIYNLFLTALLVAGLIGCEDYDLADQDIELEELPGYVAFDAPGEEAYLDDEEVTEEDGSVALRIEVPTGSLSDVNVTYTFSGTAVFGTDFTVEGASASGGSTTIVIDKAEFNDTDGVDIDITLLTDGVADGDKTLSITLESAQNTDGLSFAVGRGGTELLKTANVIITDID